MQLDLTITPARLEDAETIERMFYEAAVWLHSRGIRQWSAVWPPDPRYQAVTRERIERGWCYLARYGSQIVGTLTLQPADPRVWGDDDGAALYVHGLAIDRAAAGQGVGLVLLRWAERETTARGRRWLRLDCMAQNERLRAYYRGAGFTEVGEVGDDKGWKAALFEKLVGRE